MQVRGGDIGTQLFNIGGLHVTHGRGTVVRGVPGGVGVGGGGGSYLHCSLASPPGHGEEDDDGEAESCKNSNHN